MSDRRPAASRARERSAQLRAETAKHEARRAALVQVGVIAAAVVVILGVVVAFLMSKDDTSSAAGTAPAHVTDDGGYVVGDPDAPVTMTVVEDFQCPYCARFQQENASLLASYADGSQVKIEYRPIAFLDGKSTTDYSSRALNVAACVLDQDPDSFPAFHEALFADQPAEGGPGLDDDTLIDMAVDAGATRSDVEPCVAEDRFGDWASSTTRAATGGDFPGTPWVRVDGETVQDLSESGIRAAVEAAAQ